MECDDPTLNSERTVNWWARQRSTLTNCIFEKGVGFLIGIVGAAATGSRRRAMRNHHEQRCSKVKGSCKQRQRRGIHSSASSRKKINEEEWSKLRRPT